MTMPTLSVVSASVGSGEVEGEGEGEGEGEEAPPAEQPSINLATYQSLLTQSEMLTDMSELLSHDIIFASYDGKGSSSRGGDGDGRAGQDQEEEEDKRMERLAPQRFARANQLNYFMERFGDSFDFGRLNSRFSIMELVLFVCSHPVSTAPDDDDDNDKDKPVGGKLSKNTKARLNPTVALSSYTASEWTKLMRYLKKCRTYLLRMDANVLVRDLSFLHNLGGDPAISPSFSYRPSDGQGGHAPLTPALVTAMESHHDAQVEKIVNDETNPELAEMDIFRKEYEGVLHQFELHRDVAELKKMLNDIAEGGVVDGAAAGNTDPVGRRTRNAQAEAEAEAAAKKKNAKKGLTKKEQAAQRRRTKSEIDSFLENITKLLTTPTASTEEGNATESAAFATVRKMISDFSAYLINGLEHVTEKWADRCLSELEAVEVVLLRKLRIRVENLMQSWCSTVLNEPALVQCGYLNKAREEIMVPAAKNSEQNEQEEEDGIAEADKMAIEKDDEEMVMAQVDVNADEEEDEDEDMPAPDDDMDEEDVDEDETVGKPTPSPFKKARGDALGESMDYAADVGTDDEEESDAAAEYESQPLLTQPPAGAPFDSSLSPVASKASDEEEEEKQEEVPPTPSRITRRSADFKNKSLSKIISESAAAATAETATNTTIPASSSSRRRGGKTPGKTPIRRSPPKDVQNDSDLDYKGTPKKPAAKSRTSTAEKGTTTPRSLTADRGTNTPTRKASSKANKKLAEMATSDSESSDDEGFTAAGYQKHHAAAAATAHGNKDKKKAATAAAKPELVFRDSSEDESSDDDLSPPRKKPKRTKKPAAAASSASAAAKTPTPKANSSAKKKHTPKLSGYELATSSSSSEYEDDGDSSSSSDDENIPSPKATAPWSIPPQSNLGVNVPRSSSRARKKWTDEEKDAVKEGIRTYGVGRWAIIKAEHAIALKDRTSVQIKDCYRTMLKRGELDED